MQQELAAFRTRRPQLPLGIVLRQTIHNDADSQPESASWAKVLADGDRSLTIETADSEIFNGCSQPDRRLLRLLRRAGATPPYAIGIVFDPPSIAAPSRSDVVNILRTFGQGSGEDSGRLDRSSKAI